MTATEIGMWIVFGVVFGIPLLICVSAILFLSLSFFKKTPTIVCNKIQTPDGTILISQSRHDYVTHTDKNGKRYAIDGGRDYLKRTGPSDYKDLSVYSNAPFEEIRKNLYRGGRGKDGEQPLTWVPICEMSNNWLKNAIQYNKKRKCVGFDTKMYQKELDYRKIHSIIIEEL